MIASNRVINMSSNPSVTGDRRYRGGPGRFQPSPDPNWIGYVCNCECSAARCQVPKVPHQPGIENCIPNFLKTP
jgi:hypothetical protein